MTLKIKILQGTCAIGYGYFIGDTVEVEQEIAEKLIDSGHARMVTDDPDALADDFPGRDALLEAGINTIDAVKLITDLKEIKGIGATTAEKITAYLAK